MAFHPAGGASLCENLKSLIGGETDALANLSNGAALLYHSLDSINWAGFYLHKENQLILGPFQGKPACIRIPLGRGVCGTAAESRETVVVPDVHLFPSHIACDGASRSEIVVPLVKNGLLLGVLDIDSPVRARFSDEDRAVLERFARILAEEIRWEALLS